MTEKLSPLEEQLIRDEVARRKLEFYRPYKKQQAFHAAGKTYRERLLRAGNQCQLFSTWVDCPDSKNLLCGNIFFDPYPSVLAWDGDKECIVHTERGHLKGIEPAFRVVLDNGRFFDCSESHRFLSEGGYISLCELSARSGGLRLWQRVEDFQANCESFGYFYDGLLPSWLSSDQSQFPLSGGVRKCILSWSLEDAMERIPLYIQKRLDSGHLPIFASEVRNFWGLFSLFSVPYVPQPVLPLFDGNPEFRLLSSELTSRLRLGDVADLDQGSLPCQSGMALSSCVVDRFEPLPLSLPVGEPFLHDALLMSSTQVSGQCVGQVAIFFPFSHTPLIGGRRIISIVPLGFQPIIDCQIPDVNNYKAAGVYHHNCGKTFSAAAEVAMHATGRYPEWWEGRVFKKAPVIWCAGVTGEVVRDSIQRLLIGDIANPGTGLIPPDDVVETTPSRGVADLADTILVRHLSGGTTRIRLKYYEQGREKFQADTVDVVWLDEECDMGIYLESLTRTNATGGFLFMTFTPLKGMSEVVRRFIIDQSPDRSDTNMTIEDALHIPAAERQRIIDSYPAHERAARISGTPTLGSGRIFPLADEDIMCSPHDMNVVPWFWMELGALDFGWDHPTAAVKILYDPQGDVIYVTNVYKCREQTPLVHASALRAWGKELSFAWPHDGLQHDKGSGQQLCELYRREGLNMLAENARFADGSNGVEAGLAEMLMRMQTGRLKVYRHLTEFFEEFRLYHRKDGKVIKEFDDILAATRYAIMCLRFATPLKSVRSQNGQQNKSNYDPLELGYVKKDSNQTTSNYDPLSLEYINR